VQNKGCQAKFALIYFENNYYDVLSASVFYLGDNAPIAVICTKINLRRNIYFHIYYLRLLDLLMKGIVERQRKATDAVLSVTLRMQQQSCARFAKTSRETNARFADEGAREQCRWKRPSVLQEPLQLQPQSMSRRKLLLHIGFDWSVTCRIRRHPLFQTSGYFGAVHGQQTTVELLWIPSLGTAFLLRV